jgi:hypothetical protein
MAAANTVNAESQLLDNKDNEPWSTGQPLWLTCHCLQAAIAHKATSTIANILPHPAVSCISSHAQRGSYTLQSLLAVTITASCHHHCCDSPQAAVPAHAAPALVPAHSCRDAAPPIPPPRPPRPAAAMAAAAGASAAAAVGMARG